MARNQGALVIAGVPSVNLMPRTELERRDRSQLIRGWAGWILIAFGIIAFAMAGALWLQYAAGERLASEEARTGVLIAEIASLSDVSGALSTERALEAFRADAMAADLDWEPIHTTFIGALPVGVALQGFDLAVGGVPTGDDPAAEVGVTGTLTFASPTPVEFVALVRSYRGLAGVIYADGMEVTSAGAGVAEGVENPFAYTYILTLTIDQSLYTATGAAQEANR